MIIKGIEYKVIGSGSSYSLVVLVADDQLDKVHHFVAVYDCSNCIGVLLMYSLPKMKLDKKMSRWHLCLWVT